MNSRRTFIKVNNKREAMALMKYYENVKGWKHYHGKEPTLVHESLLESRLISYCDGFIFENVADSDCDIIHFWVAQKLLNIEVEPEEKRVNLSPTTCAVILKDKVNFVVCNENNNRPTFTLGLMKSELETILANFE